MARQTFHCKTFRGGALQDGGREFLECTRLMLPFELGTETSHTGAVRMATRRRAVASKKGGLDAHTEKKVSCLVRRRRNGCRPGNGPAGRMEGRRNGSSAPWRGLQ